MKKLLIASILVTSILAGCTHEHDNDSHSDETVSSHFNEIVFDKHKAEVAGLKYETVRPLPFSPALKVSGRIETAPSQTKTVTAPISGIISYCNDMAEGTFVTEQEKLFAINSDNMADGDPIAKTRIEYMTAADEYDRAIELAQDTIISQSELAAISQRYNNAKIAYDALAFDNNGVIVSASCKGFLSNITVKNGDFVNIGQALTTITDNSRIRLTAQVPTRHFPMLNKITSARFKTSLSDSIYDSSKLNGKTVAFSRNLDNSAFATLTMEMSNSEYLIPGSYAEIWLYGFSADSAISLPKNAIIEEQGSYSVFVQTDENCYKKIPVKLGAENGKRIKILSGLNNGDKVVTDGCIYLKLASNAGAIPGHSH